MLMVATLVARPIVVRAQDVASSFEQVRELVKPGDNVVVVDLHGRSTRGTVVEITSSAIVLIAGATRVDIPEADLATIGRPDSRWTGALWGLGIGAALGVWIDRGLVKEYGREDIGAGESAAFIAQAAGIGAGIGFIVDALVKGQRLIYSSARASTGATFAPVWTRKRKGVLVSLRF